MQQFDIIFYKIYPVKNLISWRIYRSIAIISFPKPTNAPLIPVPLVNYANSIIKESDLDLNSAATPALLSNTLYGTLGFYCQEREYPLFGNFGGSYTFSKNNDAVPRRWIIWAKMGVSF